MLGKSLVLVVILTSILICADPLPPSNHIIVFDGLANEFPDQKVASQELEKILKGLLNQTIVIHDINREGASWFSRDLASVKECPENEVYRMLDEINRQDANDYTRQFKMHLTEAFVPPKKVSVNWFGPCQNLISKRTLVNNVQTTTLTPSLLNTAETQTTTQPPELIAPQTTPDPPFTTPKPDEDDEITTVAEDQDATTDETITIGSSQRGLEEILNDDFFSSSTTTSTTTQPPTTTTTTNFPTFTEASTSTTSESTTELPPPESTTTTLLTTTSPTTILPPIDSSAMEQSTTTTPPTPTTSPDSNSAESPATESLYGKYLGFGLAFGVFLAYLIFSRSYARQGLYHVQA